MFVKPLLLAALVGLSFPAFAAPATAAPQAADDLQDIQKAINAAQSDLKKKQAAHKNAQQTLEQTRTALNKAQKELASINRQQRQTWEVLQKLQNDLNRLKTEITGTKAQVARLLAGHYKNRHPNAVMLFLKNAEPGQKTRYLQYARYINQANEKVIGELAQQQQALSVQEAAIDTELARLKKLKAQKQAALDKIGRENAAALKESHQLSTQINSQTKHIANLRGDEQRLNNLLASISRQTAEKRKKEAAARQKAARERIEAANKARAEAQAKKQPAEQAPTPTPSAPEKTPETVAGSTLTAEDRNLRPVSDDVTVQSGFSTMQGRLRRPVSSNISGRFGQNRPSGGVWRGVFFSASGASVQSIASGSVAYAGPLRGYGNIVVLDHGDDYVSVYSGLNNISVSSGSNVSAGSRIGTSGSLPSGEQGLYLEIRYQGQPMNPLSWLR